jgi:hypothetical protein
MDNGARPIDIISLIVNGTLSLVAVSLIVLFPYGPWRRYRRADKAAKQIKAIQPFLDQGRNLFNSPPESIQDVKWVFDVQRWDEETEDALYLISPNASLAFTSVSGASNTESAIRPKIGLPIRLEGDTRETYQRLQVRLETLRQIVAKPEDYL